MTQVRTHDSRLMPDRAYPSDAGADLRSINDWDIYPGDTYTVNTGISVKIPVGYVGLVFSRSGQGKLGVSLANSVGVIDASYRGLVKVMLTNNGDDIYEIKAYDTKIAQLVIMPVLLGTYTKWSETTEEEWSDTDRGSKGFGSTG